MSVNYEIRALAKDHVMPEWHEVTRDNLFEAQLAAIKWLALQGKEYETVTVRKKL
jgi:uncharacterized membrane-anchored protein